MRANVLTAADLNQFSGSEQWFRHFTGLLYTEGVDYLADKGGAYWLIDAIAPYQPTARRNQRLCEFQIWVLTVKDSAAVLECFDDLPGKVLIRQHIEYTDFPLPEIKLYFENGVLMLPSER